MLLNILLSIYMIVHAFSKIQSSDLGLYWTNTDTKYIIGKSLV